MDFVTDFSPLLLQFIRLFISHFFCFLWRSLDRCLCCKVLPTASRSLSAVLANTKIVVFDPFQS